MGRFSHKLPLAKRPATDSFMRIADQNAPSQYPGVYVLSYHLPASNGTFAFRKLACRQRTFTPQNI
jgi:hypothetical protein